LLSNLAQVFDMGITMTGPQRDKLLATFKFLTLPAAHKFLLFATFPDLAEGIAATGAAGLFASQPDHRAQHIIALLVILKLLERYSLNNPAEFCQPQFLPKVSCQIRYLSLIAETIPSV
jgi:hypothetical protein